MEKEEFVNGYFGGKSSILDVPDERIREDLANIYDDQQGIMDEVRAAGLYCAYVRAFLTGRERGALKVVETIRSAN